jgi:Ca-activated chloride channel homolog
MFARTRKQLRMLRRRTLQGFLCVAACVSALMLLGGCQKSGPMTYEKAVERLAHVKKNVEWSEDYVTRRARIELDAPQDLAAMLPSIDEFALMNRPAASGDALVLEIFASTEKSGTGTDGWMVDVANDFNARNHTLANGRRVYVDVRRIASGTAYEFIASRKYLPEAFSPSSELWVQMAAAHGVPMTLIREKTVGNIAGVVMKTSVADELKAAYGALDVKTLIDAVVQGKLAMGYTNPFASSTGLNFLFTVLATFADGREDAMLEPGVISAFESFQQGVPFVSQTTLQMRESVERGGSLGAFVMEYQTFTQTQALKSGYEFIPFGVRHDNPLYGVGDLTADQLEGLELFARFAEQSQYEQQASQYGFNPTLPYTSAFPVPAGNVLVQAQKLWKEKKDAGRPISAVFLCDISGSMAGSRINALRRSMLGGSEFIAPENSIGMVYFNHRVSVVLPIRPFDLNHKASFHAAVEDMVVEGGTAMYNGIVVSLSMLLEEKRANPNAKLTLFVLTDGETNSGFALKDVREVITALGIPIYTIGYEADLPVLQELSSLVEAASINANEEQVQYKIGELLNAQM